MDIQAILTWLKDNASWLQVIAAVFQAVASVIAIPAAIIAARWGASRAYKLHDNKEREKLEEQITSLRLLLGLEIQRNFNSLRQFKNTLALHLKAVGGEALDAEEQELLEARRRYVTLNLPELSSRFWHSQHLSPLLPIALDPLEIRQADDIYSRFERLSRIKKELAERAGQRATATDDSGGKSMSLTLHNELEDLSNDFDTILDVVLEMSNPFKASHTMRQGLPRTESGAHVLTLKN